MKNYTDKEMETIIDEQMTSYREETITEQMNSELVLACYEIIEDQDKLLEEGLLRIVKSMTADDDLNNMDICYEQTDLIEEYLKTIGSMNYFIDQLISKLKNEFEWDYTDQLVSKLKNDVKEYSKEGEEI